MPYTKKEMQLYKCHKEVRAQRIVRVRRVGYYGPGKWTGADIFLDNGACVLVDAAWMDRNPKVAEGGYFVEYQQPDFYTAYSPSAPFLTGYTLVSTDHKERIREEKQELDARLGKLRQFIASGLMYEVVPDEGEQELLETQLRHMSAYSNVLALRL